MYSRIISKDVSPDKCKKSNENKYYQIFQLCAMLCERRGIVLEDKRELESTEVKRLNRDKGGV